MSRTIWIYYVSRDSLSGELSGKCGLWGAKPLRVKHRYRVTWVGADDAAPRFLGEHPIQHVLKWFGTVPDTDRELIKVEQYAPEEA